MKWLRKLLDPGHTTKRVRAPGRRRLFLEPLEDRLAPATLIPLASVRDHVFDPVRNLLYMTTGTGVLHRYDLATQSLLSPINVGGPLNGLDITPDNNFLYIADGQPGSQGRVRKINLNTSTVTTIPYPVVGGAGIWDVNIASNGTALVSTRGSGSPLLRLDLGTDMFSIARPFVRQDTHINRSADRTLLFFTESNISFGPIFTYDAITDTFPLSASTLGSLTQTVSAVNRDGTRIAMEVSNRAAVMSRTFGAIENLGDADAGMVFDPASDVLFGADSVLDVIVAYDTHTWAELFRMEIGENIPPDPVPQGRGFMSMSPDGRLLFLTSRGTSVRCADADNRQR